MKKILRNSVSLVVAGVIALVPAPVYALSQDETVYVKLQASGTAEEISVVEHLKNDLGEDELFDQTILQDLENLNGFESFVVDGENVTWAAGGKDIYYRGKTQKELPIQLEVKYELDGEQKSLDGLLGADGKVKITFKYHNLSRVDDLYTPFVVAFATTLDESKVQNVQVTNGKVSSNGKKIAVAAVAAPGLYESLGLEELKDSDQITLEFQTENFELGDVYSIVTPKLLDKADLETFSELDSLYAQADQLSNSSQQLVAGSNSLLAGVVELRNGIAIAKSQLESQAPAMNADLVAKIKQSAHAAAEQKIATQSEVIRTSVKQQLAGNSLLLDALNREAAVLCAADLQIPACPDEAVAQYQAKLQQGIEEQLFQSSYGLAQSVAVQTAEATAESVALQVANTIQSIFTEKVSVSLSTMLSGVDQLLGGASELSNGMTRFDTEGIQPLADFVTGKVKVTADKIERLVKLAEEYDNYAGIAEDTSGSTKFILMLDEKKRQS